jgi:hypothetical protein
VSKDQSINALSNVSSRPKSDVRMTVGMFRTVTNSGSPTLHAYGES